MTLTDQELNDNYSHLVCQYIIDNSNVVDYDKFKLSMEADDIVRIYEWLYESLTEPTNAVLKEISLIDALSTYNNAMRCECLCKNKIVILSTAERDALMGMQEGWLIYNTTLSALQTYVNGTWV